MIQRQLPPWARANHPVLRSILGQKHQERNERIKRWMFSLAIMVILTGIGVFIGTDFFQDDLRDFPIAEALINVIFWPLFVLQVVMRLLTLSMTIGTIGDEQRRQTWDSLRTTSEGAELTMRARWSAVVFYRMRPMLYIVTIARLVLIGAILYDLTAFSGDYLNNLTVSITPQLDMPISVLMVALMMTASLLLPLTGVGMDAAVGLLVSTVAKHRMYVVIGQIALTAIRVAIVAGLLLLMTDFRSDGIGIDGATDIGLWLLIFGFAAMGDWGLSLLHLGFFGADVWATVPYSIFIGIALLVFVFIQALLVDGILMLAVRRAERNE